MSWKRCSATVALLSMTAVASLIGQSLEEEKWNPDGLGNHRAVVRVSSRSDVAWLDLEWRRRDESPETKAVIVIDASTEGRIQNVHVTYVDKIAARIAFQADSAPADYWIYYLPYRLEGSRNYPKAVYLPAEPTASEEWLTRNGLNRVEVDWSGIPRAELVGFESNESVNAFTEMEAVATEEEVAALERRFSDFGYVLVGEDREHSIRMHDNLPARWRDRSPGDVLALRALRGEFLSFQLGVYSHSQSLEDVKVEFSTLQEVNGRGDIPAGRLRCFNSGGIDWTGKRFTKELSLEAGRVHALWLGADIPVELQAGSYAGEVSVVPANGKRQSIPVKLSVGATVSEDRGDGDPSRLSRLRWLDSTIALDDSVVPPFKPVSVSGSKLEILGRSLTLGPDGLPATITSFFTPEMTGLREEGREILAGPVRFIVETSEAGKVEDWHQDGIRFSEGEDSITRWATSRSAGTLKLETSASLEFDGTLDVAMTLTSNESLNLSDVRLEIPLRPDIAKYTMGLGQKGGLRPDRFDWKWKRENNQDSVWLGDVNAGLQVSWHDENYVRPLNTNFYLLKPLNLPPSWHNGGSGGCELRSLPGEYLIRVFSGGREVKAGEALHFNFRFLVTPFKPIDPVKQWATRFFHSYEPVTEVAKLGATAINIHHANEINPYINYPFLSVDRLKAYIAEAHSKGLKVKIYYTVRELSNRAPEVFALRSLGDEVLAFGPGGGPSWLQEHLESNYIAGWYVPDLRDVAIINSGTSRWHNYYLEGLDWLVRNVEIDGIYIDDVAFDRTVMKRVRRILDRGRPGALIDLHSANQFNVRDGFANSANLYLEHFPYLDRLWFGEYFDYGSKPDFWLVEVSGIPFGLMGEMLQDGGNPWRGMIFGMTGRMPRVQNARHLWRLWDEFGMAGSRMIGYWVDSSPVKTDQADVLATVYAKDGEAMIALASWAEQRADVKLAIDWKALGLSPEGATLIAVSVEGFQDQAEFDPSGTIPIEPAKGWLLWLRDKE